MTSFNVTSIKKAISEFQEDFAQLTTQQKSEPLFPSERTRDMSVRPSVLRRFWTAQHSSMHSSGQQGNTVRTLVNVWEESRFPLQTRIRKTTCNRPTLGQHCLNEALIRKRVKCVIERRLEFTVRTLSAYVRTPLRELWIIVEIDFLKPINRGL
jgi:hypothetical protein